MRSLKNLKKKNETDLFPSSALTQTSYILVEVSSASVHYGKVYSLSLLDSSGRFLFAVQGWNGILSSQSYGTEYTIPVPRVFAEGVKKGGDQENKAIRRKLILGQAPRHDADSTDSDNGFPALNVSPSGVRITGRRNGRERTRILPSTLTRQADGRRRAAPRLAG